MNEKADYGAHCKQKVLELFHSGKGVERQPYDHKTDGVEQIGAWHHNLAMVTGLNTIIRDIGPDTYQNMFGSRDDFQKYGKQALTPQEVEGAEREIANLRSPFEEILRYQFLNTQTR